MWAFQSGFLILFYAFTLIPLHQSDARAQILSNMSQDEMVDIIYMSEHLSDPENVYSFGSEVGVVMHCPSIKGIKYEALVENAKNWLKIASLEFPDKMSSGGYLNSRKYRGLSIIYEDGLNKGQSDAKMIRGRRDYKHVVCKEFLEKGSDLFGPSPRLMSLIRIN